MAVPERVGLPDIDNSMVRTQQVAQLEKVRAERDALRIRIGTLLKTETVSLLLGAGASVESGGVLMSCIPVPVERLLLEQGVSGEQKPRLRRWLRLFYLAARRESGDDEIPLSREAIIARWQALNGQGEKPSALPVNFERLLSTMFALARDGDETPPDTAMRGTPEQVAPMLARYADHGISELIVHFWPSRPEAVAALAEAAQLARGLIAVQ